MKNNEIMINIDYLKHVILKYFIYSESHNYKEANILMHVILTILKMNSEER